VQPPNAFRVPPPRHPIGFFTITLATAFRSDFADVLAEEIRVVPTLCELTVEVPCEKPAELAKEDPPELEP
jgi:hypothetical protein